MGKYFGTDGFRGRANESLTAIQAFRVGRFLGKYYSRGRHARIVVGKDTRRSSYMLEYSLAAGAAASGADVYLLHVTTTPSVSYVTRTEAYDCGVMISASHNPYTDNGIKLLNGMGEKMEEGVLSLVEEYLDGGTIPLATGSEIGRTIDHVAGRNRYLAYLLSLPKCSFRGLKVGLDCANGSAFMIAKSVFDALGANTCLIGGEPDGSNINEGCGSTHPERLQELVREKSLDMGFAFDGDADRCIAVDERGEIVNGDGILFLSAKRLRERGELDGGGIVATLMSNYGLVRSLEKEGIAVRLTEVGDKFVYEEMMKGGFMLGGEESGHVIFRKYATTGDGIVTALMVTETVLEKKCPLSCLTRGFEPLRQKKANVRVKDKAFVLASREVHGALDRAKELVKEGRVLLRASGTEPVIRILAEGENTQSLDEAVSLLIRAVHAAEEEL